LHNANFKHAEKLAGAIPGVPYYFKLFSTNTYTAIWT
jgi:hypothetical protein